MIIIIVTPEDLTGSVPHGCGHRLETELETQGVTTGGLGETRPGLPRPLYTTLEDV